MNPLAVTGRAPGPPTPSRTPHASLHPVTQRRHAKRLEQGLPPPETPLRRDPGNPLAPGNYYSLAERSGLSRQHVARVLSGRGGVTLESAGRIAEAAGVTIGELQAHIDEMKRMREEDGEKVRESENEPAGA